MFRLHAAFNLYRRYPILCSAILLGLAVRIYMIVEVIRPFDKFFSDPYRHWQNGEFFFQRHFMSLLDPPLYQLFILGLRAISDSPMLPFTVASVILSLTMPLAFGAAVYRFAWGPRAALFATLCLTIFPSTMVNYSFIMPESLMLTLIGLALWASACFWARPVLWRFLLATTLWTLATLTKQVAIIPAAIFTGIGWWLHLRNPKSLVAAMMLVTILIIPNGLRTLDGFGRFAPLGKGWIPEIIFLSHTLRMEFVWFDKRLQKENSARLGLFYNGTGDYHTVLGGDFLNPEHNQVYDFGPLGTWRISRDEGAKVPHVNARAANHGQEFDDLIKKLRTQRSWSLATKQMAENILLYFVSESWPEHEILNKKQAPYNTQKSFLWTSLALIFFIWTARILWQRRSLPIIPFTAFILSIALMVQPYAILEGRYRKVVEPFVILSLICYYRMERHRGHRRHCHYNTSHNNTTISDG